MVERQCTAAPVVPGGEVVNMASEVRKSRFKLALSEKAAELGLSDDEYLQHDRVAAFRRAGVPTSPLDAAPIQHPSV